MCDFFLMYVGKESRVFFGGYIHVGEESFCSFLLLYVFPNTYMFLRMCIYVCVYVCVCVCTCRCKSV